MPRGGSKPGERRGGRQKGVPNKVTIERVVEAEKAIIEAKAARKKLAKEVLEDFMYAFASMAAFYQPRPGLQGGNADENQFERWAKLAIDCADKLAPYQSPTFRAIAVVDNFGEPPPPPANEPKLIEGTTSLKDMAAAYARTLQ